ncbi:MAG: DUF1415 domain-containing protein [Pseudomonadota bacterium]
MSHALDATARWIENTVIGRGLCPFARGPWQASQVRMVQSAATSEQALVNDLAKEVLGLLAHEGNGPATTVLVHPDVLNDFENYNAFLEVADEVLRRLGAEGVLQIASFHPQYRFDGEPPDDASHFTNRSPFPMLHLLREDDVSRAVDGATDVEQIPERNVARLRDIGVETLAGELADLAKP